MQKRSAQSPKVLIIMRTARSVYKAFIDYRKFNGLWRSRAIILDGTSGYGQPTRYVWSIYTRLFTDAAATILTSVPTPRSEQIKVLLFHKIMRRRFCNKNASAYSEVAEFNLRNKVPKSTPKLCRRCFILKYFTTENQTSHARDKSYLVKCILHT